jgi:LPS export ABC transporter protein LptC
MSSVQVFFSTGPVCSIAKGFFIFALVVIIPLLNGCEEKVKPSVTSLEFSNDIPSQESWNATITFTDSGRVTGILRAGHILDYAMKRVTFLDSMITIDFFDDSMRHTSVLTAVQGLVNNATQDLEAHGNVIVVSDSGSTLRTESLYWTNRTQRIHTPDFVEITTPTESIQGHGFESDRSLKNRTIYKVTGRAKPNGK